MQRRTLSSDSVTLTEVRLRDAELPESASENPRLLMQVSAPVMVELCLDGRPERRLLRPGDFCIVPPGPSPQARWPGTRDLLIAVLSPRLLTSVAEACRLRSFHLARRVAVEDPQITHLLFALHAELNQHTHSGPAFVEPIARALAIRLLTAHTEAPARAPCRGGLSRPALRRVLEFMDRNLERDLSLRALAEICELSVDHFARAFRESTGAPPHRYLVRRRLARARQLLEQTNRPIADIAQTLGFADQSHLTNVFRRHFGATPARTRTLSEPVDLLPVQ